MKGYFKSFSFTLVILISIILAVVCVSLGVISYNSASQAVNDEVDKALLELSEQGGYLIRSYLDLQMEKLEMVADDDIIKDVDRTWEEKLAVLNEEIARAGHVRMGIADLNGELTSSNGAVSDITTREYYQEALAGKTAVSDPIVSKVDGSVIIIYATPIKSGNQTVGVLVAIRDGNDLSEITDKITFGESGEGYMNSKDGTIIAHKNRDLVVNMHNALEQVKTDPSVTVLAEMVEVMMQGEAGTWAYTFEGQESYVGFSPVPGTTWSLAVKAPAAEVLQGVENLRNTIFMTSLIFIIVGIMLAAVLANRTVRPLKKATELTQSLAEGDWRQEVSEKDLKRGDEFGDLSRAINEMIINIRKLVSGIVTMVNEVAASSEELMATSQSTAANMEEVSASTEEMAASLEEVSASADEISASSQEMNGTVENLNNEMKNGSDKAKAIENNASEIQAQVLQNQKTATEVYTDLEGRMKAAIEKAKIIDEISSMASLISDIASQTNLLALNAAIEAARAGEQGRGFAVVAEEVRKLAEQSAETVTRIQGLTEQVHANVGELTKDAQALLEFMSTDVDKDYKEFVNTADKYKMDAVAFYNLTQEAEKQSQHSIEVVTQVAKAIEEVTSSINQSNLGVQQIAQSTDHSSKSMVQINDAAVKLAEMAEELSNMAGKFKV